MPNPMQGNPMANPVQNDVDQKPLNASPDWDAEQMRYNMSSNDARADMRSVWADRLFSVVLGDRADEVTVCKRFQLAIESFAHWRSYANRQTAWATTQAKDISTLQSELIEARDVLRRTSEDLRRANVRLQELEGTARVAKKRARKRRSR